MICEWQQDETVSQWQTAHWLFIDWLCERRLQEEEEVPLFVTFYSTFI